MAKKPTPEQPAPTDQAQQIWLAGLGAFSQAQKKGSEALQKMLQDGLHLQRQAQHTAEQKIADATEKMSVMAQQLAKGKMAAPENKGTPWGGLEGLFEQRVAQALQRLGWANPDRIAALEQRIQSLEQQLSSQPSRAQASTPTRKPRNG